MTASSTNRFSPVLIISIAFSPFSASSTSYPAFSRTIRTTALTDGSSSAMRIRPFPVNAPNRRSDLYSTVELHLVMAFSFVVKSLEHYAVSKDLLHPEILHHEEDCADGQSPRDENPRMHS